MPKSRRRKNTDALLDAKNVVRGSRSVVEGLSRARPLTPSGKLSSLADWTLKSFALGDFTTSLRPRRIGELLSPNILEPVSLEAEIEWVVAVFVRFAQAINEYVQARASINNVLLLGKRDGIEDYLSDLSRKVGPSLFEIQIRIATAQVFEGLERQKAYINELRDQRPAQNVKFFAHWWGVRAEDGHTAGSFIAEINERSGKWDVSEHLLALIRFHLLREVPEKGAEQSLLAAASSTPVVDFYETFVSLAADCVAEGRDSAPTFLNAARTLLAKISDPRLINLLALSGDAAQAARLVCGDHRQQDAEAAGRAESSSTPTDMDELRALVARGVTAASEQNPLVQRLQRALTNALGTSIESFDFGGELRKLGIVFRGLPFGDWCWSFGEGERLAAPLRSVLSERTRFLQTNTVSAAALPILPPNVRTIARTALLESGAKESVWAADARIEETSDTVGLAPRVKFEAAVERMSTAGGDADALLAMSMALREESGIIYRRGVFTEVDALLTLGDNDAAISAAGKMIVRQPRIVDWLPGHRLSESLTPSRENRSTSNIYLSICLDALVRAGRADLVPPRFYATEDFMASYGVDRPTALRLDSSAWPHDAQVYFLANLCTPAILKLSVAYGTEQELKEDRLELCKKLTLLDASNAETYEAEARSIVRDSVIRKALDQIQRSKISIDEEALFLWGERNVRQEYDRYRALLASGVVVVDDAFRKALYAAYEAGDVTKTVLSVPQNEASELFQTLVARLFYEFALSSEHGLDSYLSVRIRHGTISGLVRSPSEAEHLVTRKAAGATFYKSNAYWIEQLNQQSISGEIVEGVDRLLRGFSADLDNAIRRLTDKFIQVEREEKPDGLFKLRLAAASVFGLASEVTPETSFREFFARAATYFWALVEASLQHVRAHIDKTFREEMRTLFDELESALEQKCGPGACPYLIDAVRRSRTETMHALDRMLEWFTLPTPIARLSMHYQDLVQLAETTIKSLHPQFQPKIDPHCEDVPPVEGMHRLFDDIFFIIFENIMLRSGNEHDPAITVRAWMEGECLMTRVENDVTADALPFAIDGVATAKQKLNAGSYLSSVPREGGTGLPKLLKLLRVKANDPNFDFGLDEATRRYFIQFPIELYQPTETAS
jgi:hypothetical protein